MLKPLKDVDIVCLLPEHRWELLRGPDGPGTAMESFKAPIMERWPERPVRRRRQAGRQGAPGHPSRRRLHHRPRAGVRPRRRLRPHRRPVRGHLDAEQHPHPAQERLRPEPGHRWPVRAPGSRGQGADQAPRRISSSSPGIVVESLAYAIIGHQDARQSRDRHCSSTTPRTPFRARSSSRPARTTSPRSGPIERAANRCPRLRGKPLAKATEALAFERAGDMDVRHRRVALAVRRRLPFCAAPVGPRTRSPRSPPAASPSPGTPAPRRRRSRLPRRAARGRAAAPIRTLSDSSTVFGNPGP